MTGLSATEQTGPLIVLTCAGCGRVERITPWFRLTKMGTLRLSAGSSGFYVDGGYTYCRECVPADMKDAPPQRETWTEYDRRTVEMEAEDD